MIEGKSRLAAFLRRGQALAEFHRRGVPLARPRLVFLPGRLPGLGSVQCNGGVESQQSLLRREEDQLSRKEGIARWQKDNNITTSTRLSISRVRDSSLRVDLPCPHSATPLPSN